MRSKTEQAELNTVRLSSIDSTQTFRNKVGEVFVFKMGKLVEYTDTRVIEHETDRLVNLAETPFISNTEEKEVNVRL